MVEWNHQFDGHEFEQTLGDSEGQGSLACCSPWGCKVLDMTYQLNNNNNLVNEEWLMSLMNLGNKMGMCHMAQILLRPACTREGLRCPPLLLSLQ